MSTDQQEKTGSRSALFFLIFYFLAAGIITASYLISQSYNTINRNEVESQLSAIAELKVVQLSQWRKERVGDAMVIYNNAQLANLVRRYFSGSRERGDDSELREWLGQYPTYYDYDLITLIDPHAAISISIPASRTPLSAVVLKHIPELLQSKKITVVDLYRNEQDQEIYFTILCPILDKSAEKRVVGVVSLRVDPKKYLYPFILNWPTTSRSAETLLVRRDGDDALFLNELKFRKDSVLTLRIPLKRTEVPAVKAVLGESGIVEGEDYRNVPVIADLRGVPGSPWFLVTRMDLSELYSKTHFQNMLIIYATIFLIIGVGVSLAFIRRRQRMEFYEVQYKSAEALRDSEKKYRMLVNNLPSGLVVHTPDSAILFSNPMASELLGLTEEQMQGKRSIDPAWCFLCENGEPLPLEEYPVNRVLSTSAPFTSQVLGVRRPDRAEPVWVQCNAYPVLDTEGRMRQAVITFFDITVLKTYEKELQQKNAELERFTYTVSHDLKSPIITIKGFTGSLEKDLINGNYQRMAGDLKRVSAAADKMDNLLRDLLKLSTVGRIINTPEPVAMNLLVDDVLAQLAGPLKNHNVTVAVQPNLPTVLCDRRRMGEVLQNLIENAINYMGDSAEPRIEIGVRKEAGENIFFVQDNGIGIDEKFNQIIFGLFNKLDAESEGTGIGLALVKRIIEVHGGRVWVESEGAGLGSRFCFELPLVTGVT